MREYNTKSLADAAYTGWEEGKKEKKKPAEAPVNPPAYDGLYQQAMNDLAAAPFKPKKPTWGWE